MKLLISTQSYSWFKRQWWQLSSIVEQKDSSNLTLPEVVYRIHLFKQDPNIEFARKMISIFDKFINFDIIEWANKEKFSSRSNTRNIDILSSYNYDGVLFLDPDIILHSELLAKLSYYKDTEHLITCGRKNIPNSIKLVNQESYIEPIRDLYNKINDRESSPILSKLGAGFFQFASVVALNKFNITNYCSEPIDRSIFNTAKFLTHSEVVFRKKFGHVKFGDMLTRVWHMEHTRGIPFDCN